jgi:hypothetical protein
VSNLNGTVEAEPTLNAVKNDGEGAYATFPLQRGSVRLKSAQLSIHAESGYRAKIYNAAAVG